MVKLVKGEWNWLSINLQSRVKRKREEGERGKREEREREREREKVTTLNTVARRHTAARIELQYRPLTDNQSP